MKCCTVILKIIPVQDLSAFFPSRYLLSVNQTTDLQIFREGWKPPIHFYHFNPVLTYKDSSIFTRLISGG